VLVGHLPKEQAKILAPLLDSKAIRAVACLESETALPEAIDVPIQLFIYSTKDDHARVKVLRPQVEHMKRPVGTPGLRVCIQSISSTLRVDHFFPLYSLKRRLDALFAVSTLVLDFKSALEPVLVKSTEDTGMLQEVKVQSLPPSPQNLTPFEGPPKSYMRPQFYSPLRTPQRSLVWTTVLEFGIDLLFFAIGMVLLVVCWQWVVALVFFEWFRSSLDPGVSTGAPDPFIRFEAITRDLAASTRDPLGLAFIASATTRVAARKRWLSAFVTSSSTVSLAMFLGGMGLFLRYTVFVGLVAHLLLWLGVDAKLLHFH